MKNIFGTILEDLDLCHVNKMNMNAIREKILKLHHTILSKNVSNSKSFPHAVNEDDGPVSNCVDTGFLSFFEKVHINSPPKCSTSEQDPPFPTNNILFPFVLHFIISFEILINFFSSLIRVFNVSDRLSI